MAEVTESATEASVALAEGDERSSYEFAFHILPTVAEEEVPGVFEELKALITKAGGEVKDGETPERIDLAYEISKSVEGKSRSFASAYFGWVRFSLEGEALNSLDESFTNYPSLLRYMIIKLTRAEEAEPFRFHENRKSIKMVEVVDEAGETLAEKHTEVEENVEVSEEALDKSLGKITDDTGEEEESEAEETKA